MCIRWIPLLLPLPLCALVLAGCKPQSGASADRVPPNPAAPALYGQPKGTVSEATPSAPSPAPKTNWIASPFHVLHTDLSPAILIHSSTRYLGLFSDLSSSGLGAPSHVAWSTREGPRSFKQGLTQDSTGMEENWLLFWFAGATNWTNWDAPWAIFLQHKPTWTRLDADGLHLEFPSTAGDVVIMPLYGYFKLPPFGRDYLVEHGLKSRKLYSWEWEKGIARDPLARLRFWAGALREFPVYCEETFSVDRARDEVTIRSRFQWHSINDDWNTKHFKLAPISPPLGLVAKDKNFPVRFSKPFFDMELPTPFGPYLAIQDVDSYDATFSVLHYVNEFEAFHPPKTNAHPTVVQALEKLHQFTRTNPPLTRIDLEPPDWTFLGVGLLARAMPYLEKPVREKLAIHLKTSLLAKIPDGQTERAELQIIAEGVFEAAWAYGHYTDDWDTVRKLWVAWRPKLEMLPEGSWATFGVASNPNQEKGKAQEYAALARVAYRMGDMEWYHDASRRFVGEVVQICMPPRHIEYFQKNYPLYSMDWMDHPRMSKEQAQAGEARSRLMAVNDPGVVRLYHDYVREEARLDLDWLQRCSTTNGTAQTLVSPRGLLLNETPAQLATIATPDQFRDWEGAEPWLAVLRASRLVHYERLIPPGAASPFVAGLERKTGGATPKLLTILESSDERTWPRLTWPDWKTPTGAPWNFGRIQPVRDGQPPSTKRTPLNRNTEVLTYTLP